MKVLSSIQWVFARMARPVNSIKIAFKAFIGGNVYNGTIAGIMSLMAPF